MDVMRTAFRCWGAWSPQKQAIHAGGAQRDRRSIDGIARLGAAVLAPLRAAWKTH